MQKSNTPDGRLVSDPDFIAIKRYDYSLKKLLAAFPNGAPERIIAQALGIKEPEVAGLYRAAVLKLRDAMHVNVED